MNKLEVENIQLGYTGEIPAIVQGLSLTVNPGEFLGIVGPNGSGKSTLVRALSRVLAPIRGTVLLSGRNLYTDLSARESARSVSTVPQSTTITFDFTVREIVEMGRAPHQSQSPFAQHTSRDGEIVAEAMRKADVLGLADRIASTLSGGEQQRVLLARALAQEPEILLLDEPTSHLDLHHQTQVLRVVRHLTTEARIGTLAVLHDLNLAASYADRLLLMAGGRVVAVGTPAEVLTEANIQQAYGARVWVRCHPVSGRPIVLTLPDTPYNTVAVDSAPDVAVHVICGAGTGVGLLLRLRQLGYNISAAGLNAGDTDQEAAEMLGIPYAREAPFTAFSEPVVEKAEGLMATADIVVITDVPFGYGNLANLQSALAGRKQGKVVLALETAQPNAGFAGRDFTKGVATGLWAELIRLGMPMAPDVEALVDLIYSSISSDN